MVSTDAAARGIDIPNITHVIQADFAASAVEFIHRVNPHPHTLHEGWASAQSCRALPCSQGFVKTRVSNRCRLVIHHRWQHLRLRTLLHFWSTTKCCGPVYCCDNVVMFVTCMQVGRTARQGQMGQLTSLYSPDRKPLAEAVKAAIEADVPVEGAFSRNRSFSKKFKKYGRFVPRGQSLAA